MFLNKFCSISEKTQATAIAVAVVFSVGSFSLSTFAQPAPTQPASAATSSAISNLSTTSSMPATNEVKPKANKTFGLALSLEYSSNMLKEGSVGHQAGTAMTIAPSYKISDRFSMAAETIIEKQHTAPGDTTISNTIVGLSMKGYKFNDQVGLSHSLSATLPTNKEIRDRDRLQVGATIGTKIAADLKSVILVGGVTLRKNVHEFNINANGSPNIEYTLSERLDLEIPMGDKFAYTATGIYRTSWTYGGFQRNSFLFDTGLDFAATPALTLSAGVTNEASALKANGRDSNIALYDEKTSVMRAGMTYKF